MAALTVSLIMLPLYGLTITMQILSIMGQEVPLEDAWPWNKVAIVEATVQAVIALLYVIMVCYSCVAVHRWRRASGRSRRGRGGDGQRGDKESGTVGGAAVEMN